MVRLERSSATIMGGDDLLWWWFILLGKKDFADLQQTSELVKFQTLYLVPACENNIPCSTLAEVLRPGCASNRLKIERLKDPEITLHFARNTTL